MSAWKISAVAAALLAAATAASATDAGQRSLDLARSLVAAAPIGKTASTQSDADGQAKVAAAVRDQSQVLVVGTTRTEGEK